MAHNFQEDFQPILFSTFKPIPENKGVPCNSKSCHEETSHPIEVAAEAKNKNTDSSSAIFVHKETSRVTGATLKDQTYQWFESTQRMKLLKNGQFADWFHGFITRNRAEEILHNKPVGCFLIRFCESRVGFVLTYRFPHLFLAEILHWVADSPFQAVHGVSPSNQPGCNFITSLLVHPFFGTCSPSPHIFSYRGTERCRHFMINHLEDERYLIEGEKRVHPSLEDLVNHYCMFPVEPYKEMLTTACPMVEHASTSFAVNVPSFPRKEPPTNPQDLNPLFVYAEVKKPSGDHNRNEEASCSVTPKHIPSEESHTYTEPTLWNQPRVESSNNVSEPIAFYAVGRGSCKENLENVYSEVDINAITTSQSRAAMNHHPGHSTLPHPASKAIKHKTKTTAFHASFHSHKPNAVPQEDARRGHFSRSNMKPHAAIQLDDPTYGKDHLQQTGSSGVYEENIYEKIPENCVHN